MVNTITLKELRPGLPQVIERIDARFDRYIVTRRGKPVCVMLGVDDYESMLETMDILADPALVKRIKKAEKNLAEGKTISLAELQKKLERVQS
jgi:prevent-host-death family protein